MSGCDYVIHLAAVPSVAVCEDEPCRTIENNVMGTINVCRAAYKHRVKVIFASSFAVTHPVNCKSVYGLSKSLCEKIVSEYGGVSCRLSNVYGGENYAAKKDSVVARLLKGTYEERGDGDEVRDFIHVDDVCVGLYESRDCVGVVEVCSGRLTSISELVELSKHPSFPDNLRK